MKNLKFIAILVLVLTSIHNYSQQNPQPKKIKVTGTVIEKVSKQPLEYATIRFVNIKNPKGIFGGITNAKGEFDVEISQGMYDIKIEFISFKPFVISQKKLPESTDLGQISLEDDATQLNEVVVRAETTSIQIKLDKKVYSVGNDLMVKGGTVSDVLDNIPSVSVDAEGVISLRGNENVTIFIDGKPSNAINISEALRLIPAESIDKVEVITNPSARYDAEGGAGILNIILKKGTNLGFNGTLIATTGYPTNNGLSGNLNYKTKKYNLFTNQGYNYRKFPGNSLIETDYLNPKPDSPIFILETRENERLNKSYNGNLGIELFLNESTSWTNSINYRKSNGDFQDDVNFDNQFVNSSDNYTRTRVSDEDAKSENVEYISNLVKKFKKDGHKLTVDVQIAKNDDTNISNIIDSENGNDYTQSIQNQNKELFQTDYVLPIGKNSQFEAGYRGSFQNLTTDFYVENNDIINPDFTNKLEYIENINAVYSQFGFKINKFSYLFGLRWEASDIEINLFTTNVFNHKTYNDFFPSAFFTYEISEQSSLSLNYSRRINRPRGMMIIPFRNYSSNINIFRGNPDLDPTMTNSVDFGYLKKWNKFMLSTSLYAKSTKNVWAFARIESGDYVNDVPIIISGPINIDTEFRTGFEFNLNYTPYKWWRLNTNFNFYNIDTQGDYSYTDFNDQVVTQNFDKNASSWSAKLTSKVTLPNKIDWQTNMNYIGDQKTAQGKVIGAFTMNLGFSKDVMKDKATVSFNINDVFNTQKRKIETLIPGVIQSYAEMQFHQRQFNLSFTYRFNKQKNDKEKEKQPKREFEGGDDFQG